MEDFITNNLKAVVHGRSCEKSAEWIKALKEKAHKGVDDYVSYLNTLPFRHRIEALSRLLKSQKLLNAELNVQLLYNLGRLYLSQSMVELENKNTRVSSSSINDSSFYFEESGKAFREFLAARADGRANDDDDFLTTQRLSLDQLSEDLMDQMAVIKGTLFKEEADKSLRSLMSSVYDSKESDDDDDDDDDEYDDEDEDHIDDDDDDDDDDDEDDTEDSKDDDDDDDKKIERAWDVIDLYRVAILQTKGKNLEVEAEAMSQIGYIYEQVLGENAKAKACFYSCFNVCESMRPKTFKRMPWFIR
jgi:hypothetical protein